MLRQSRRLNSKLIAFIAIMCAVANVLSLFSIPLGITQIHLTQLPIILSGLALGPMTGGLVGFIGAVVMAFRLSPPNPYILPGNAILGFFTGLFYLRLKKMGGRPIIPQVISVLGAYIVQFPYVYVTDVYFWPKPAYIVLTIILPKLLIEDIISVLLAHFILFRVNIAKILRRARDGAAKELDVVLNRVKEFHGHLGSLLVLGVRIDLIGVRELKANWKKLRVTRDADVFCSTFMVQGRDPSGD